MRVRRLTADERAEFGALLRGARERAGLSLRAAARRACISPTYLSKIECGEFGPPAAAALERLAEVICVDSWWLLRRAGHLNDEFCRRLLELPPGMQHAIRDAVGNFLVAIRHNRSCGPPNDAGGETPEPRHGA